MNKLKKNSLIPTPSPPKKKFNLSKCATRPNSKILNKQIKKGFYTKPPKNKIEIQPIDALLEVLGFTTFSIYLVIFRHSYLSDTLI